MRIALISEHASPLAPLGGVDAGGQNLHVAELSAALSRLGHEVRVYTRRDAPGLPARVRMPSGATVVHVPAGPAEQLPKDDLLPYMKAFGGWLGRGWQSGWSPDVVHAHFWMSGLAALTARRTYPVPLVQTYHALGSVKRRCQHERDTSLPARVPLERALGRAVDRVVAQCRDEVRELVRLGVPRVRISVVPSGVDADHFCPHGPSEPRDPRRPRILSVGRLVPRKGFDDVIRSLRLVPRAECVIIGGPAPRDLGKEPEAARLRELARGCRVADRVRLVGAVPREDMPRWYRSADVVACAPWYEPFGLTPLEAMACGVPVVATAVGGLIDTVVDGLTGDLVPPRDPTALGRALRAVISDPVRRMGYATAGMDRARQCYPWERTAAQLAAIYAEVSGEPVAEPAAEAVAP